MFGSDKTGPLPIRYDLIECSSNFKPLQGYVDQSPAEIVYPKRC